MKKPNTIIQNGFRDGLTGQFITKKRAKKLSKKRVTKVSLKKPRLSGATAP